MNDVAHDINRPASIIATHLLENRSQARGTVESVLEAHQDAIDDCKSIIYFFLPENH